MNNPETLIDDYFDGELEASDLPKLERWLAEKPAHRKTFLRAAHDHASIPLALQSLSPRRLDALPLPTPHPTPHRALRWALPIAACLAILFALRFLTPPAQSGELVLLAGLASGWQLERAGRIHPLATNESLLPGDLLRTTPSGTAHLGYQNELTRLNLQPNTTLRVLPAVAGKQFELLRGSLKLDIARQPRRHPLTLHTPQAKLQLADTRLDLFAGPKSTRARVATGRIQLLQPGTHNPVTVPAGQLAIAGATGPLLIQLSEPGPNITLDATSPIASHPAQPATAIPPCPTGALASPPPGTGAILREYWFNLPGYTPAGLTSSQNFPNTPSGHDYPTSLEASDGGPAHDLYGTRWRGLLHPTATGPHTFWIAADDSAELLLGSDHTPSNLRPIARVPSFTWAREWTKFAEQESALIHLEAGRTYSIEILHKELAGGDHLAVAWQPPGSSPQIIPGTHLSPPQ